MLMTPSPRDFSDILNPGILHETSKEPNELPLPETLDLGSTIGTVPEFSGESAFWDNLPDDVEEVFPSDRDQNQTILDIIRSQANQLAGPWQDLERQITQPQQQIVTINRAPEIFSLPSALPDYFFKEVVSLYCTWDTSSNPLRIMLGDMWQSSGALFHTVQSMAAACLSEDFPHLAIVAKNEHRNAIQYLRSPPGPTGFTEDRILATFLLGHTSSWLDPHDLADEKFKQVWRMIKSGASNTRNSPGLAFLEEALDYWTMLLAFVTDTKNAEELSIEPYSGPSQLTPALVPHSWNGISRDVVRMITETGRLIFGVRKRMSAFRFVNQDDLDVFRDGLREAHRLEQSLLAYCPTDMTQITDPGDPRTTLEHFHLMDEAYRFTGLLQLYRVFPDLLTKRYQPWDKDKILFPQSPLKVPSRREMDVWLTKLAMHILGILREIPFESRTRCIQPFVLVAVSSELRYNAQNLQDVALSNGGPGNAWIDHTSIEIARARKFVGSRLSAYTHILPLRKVQQIYELVNCIWAALDAGDPSVYWVDIACQTKFSTVMG